MKLPHLDVWTKRRRQNASRYHELFRAANLESRGVRLPIEPEGSFHVFNQYVVRTPCRDELRAWLQAGGVATEIYYPVPFHLQECLAHLGYTQGAFPHAEAAAEQCLALPIYPELSATQQEYVVERIRQFHA